MNIYLLRADVNNYQILVFKNGEDSKVLSKMNGQSFKNNWKSFDLDPFIDDNFNKNLPKGDFPYLSNRFLILSSKAVNCLKDLITPYGEVLPVNCDDDDYTLFNVTNVIDVLDLEKSNVRFLYNEEWTNKLKPVD